MNSELKKLIENWETVVKKKEIANAFMYKDSDGVKLLAKKYKIDWTTMKEIVRIENLVNIRITMGCKVNDLTAAIGNTPTFAPIISGIGTTGEKKHFEMSFYPNKNGIEITPAEKTKYVKNWSEKLYSTDNNKMDRVFITKNCETLKYYTFDDDDTIAIKNFCEERKDFFLFLHLGLEPSPPNENPFKFRTVLEIGTKDEISEAERYKFYQLSSPCPPNCGRIIIR